MLLQAYAPLPHLPDRALLLLGCTRSGCGKGPGCWQAVRCQLQPPAAQDQQQQVQPQPQEQQQQQPQQQNGVDHQPAGLQPRTTGSSTGQPGPTGFDALDAPGFSAAGATNTWGFGGDAVGGSSSFGGWDAAQSAGSNGSNAFDFSDLTSSLAATAQKQQQHQQREAKKKKQQQQQKQQVTDTAAAGDLGLGAGDVTQSTRGAAGPELPEFYLMAEPEPGEVVDTNNGHGCGVDTYNTCNPQPLMLSTVAAWTGGCLVEPSAPHIFMQGTTSANVQHMWRHLLLHQLHVHQCAHATAGSLFGSSNDTVLVKLWVTRPTC